MRFGELLGALVKLALFIGAIGLVLKLFFVEVYEVPNNAMAPTAVRGDTVLVWRAGSAELGNIMLCEHPSRTGELVMGRALAFAGHTVSTDRFGNIYVDNDRSTTEVTAQQRFYDVTRNKLFQMDLGNIQFSRLHTGTHTYEYYIEHETTLSIPPTLVNRGLYLLADNRSDPDNDSRAFGEVDGNRCIGQVFMRLFRAPSRDDDLHHGVLDTLH